MVLPSVVNPFARLAALLSPGGQVHFMPNGGNLGDALINQAAIQGFRRCGIPWRLLRGGGEWVREGDLLVYGGGGSLVEDYPGSYGCLHFLHGLGARVAVLPQTVRGNAAFWRDLPPTLVFCRDPVSYDYMQGFPQHEVQLAHDLAPDLLLNTAPFETVLHYRQALERLGLLQEKPLLAFRVDGEATANRDRSQIDLSGLAYPDMQSLATIESAALSLLHMVAPFRRIETDRLHVMIAGALLGLEVAFHDTNHGKLSAIHAFSLRDRFPHVRPAAAHPAAG
jgi:CDP-glycerol glycerophosphotransferase